MFLSLDRPAPVAPNICAIWLAPVSTVATIAVAAARVLGSGKEGVLAHGEDDPVGDQGFEGDGHCGGKSWVWLRQSVSVQRNWVDGEAG
jgi:hypothetical protein